MKHRPELQWHTAYWRRPTRSSVRRYGWSHRNSPRAPTEPNAWAESVSKAHRRSGQGHHQEGARDGMSERLRQGLQLRNKCEKVGRPPKGKDQAEREELSQTRCRSEVHSKRAGNPRASRESSGRGRSLTRKTKKSPSTKDNLLTGGSAEQVDLEADLRSGEHNGEIQ